MSRGWGAMGTEGGSFGSFAKRYGAPLMLFARSRFGLDHDRAGELTQRFFLRELEREREAERAIFRLFDAERGRFRSLLARSFWRFCRDELAKEGRRRVLAAFPDESAVDDFEMARLVSRDMLNSLRREVEGRLTDGDDRRVLGLKWPVDLSEPPLTNAEVCRRLGLARGVVRGALRRIADFLTHALNRRLLDAGLDAEDARELLGDYWRALDEEDRRSHPAAGSAGEIG